MFKANLRNQVRQTALPKWKPLIPVFEAVINSIQSIKDANRTGTGSILIEVERETDLLGEGQGAIQSITVTDNGIGLDDDNFDSFNTAYSDWKEAAGGKGLGRFTWLKAFAKAEITSVFQAEGDSRLRRNFVFDEKYDADEGTPVPANGQPIGTKVRLVGFKEPYNKEFKGSAELLTERLIEHFLLIFLEPNCPRISIQDGSFVILVNEVFEKEFKAASTTHQFEIKGVPFTLRGFRLSTPRLTYHKLIYAANQRSVVSDNLRDYIPNLNARLPDGKGGNFVYLGTLQSPYLTHHVNAVRTDFDLATEDADIDQADMFADQIRRQDIRDEAIRHIQTDLGAVLSDINQEKEARIRNYVHRDAPQYKVLMKYAADFIDKIHPGATNTEIEVALHKELYQRESDLKREGASIIKEADKIDDYAAYHSRLQQFMDSYNELGVAALAQHVMHRRIMIELLEKAILIDSKTQKFPLEEVVHHLVFPMRTTSDDIPYHEQNLWMIDERLTYHSFVSSDNPLKSNANRARFATKSERRPDLFIFDEALLFSDGAAGEQPINSITVVEFKRPGRNDYNMQNNPLTQSFELIKRIREGRFLIDGRPVVVANDQIPATAYAVCDLTPSLREVLDDMDAFGTADRQAYYGFHRNNKVYFEVIDYTKLLKDASKRNRIFFEKLNILGV